MYTICARTSRFVRKKKISERRRRSKRENDYCIRYIWSKGTTISSIWPALNSPRTMCACCWWFFFASIVILHAYVCFTQVCECLCLRLLVWSFIVYVKPNRGWWLLTAVRPTVLFHIVIPIHSDHVCMYVGMSSCWAHLFLYSIEKTAKTLISNTTHAHTHTYP